jgi:hypothetical protein
LSNDSLTSAKKAKNDEFYTQFVDIQKEIEAYLEYDPDTFRGKVVYCNCDDPLESNFFRYFVLNFEKLGLKQLITTSYKPSPIDNVKLGRPNRGRPGKFVINKVSDFDGDGQFNLKDVAKQLKANRDNEWTALQGNGDFRSPECIEILKQADIVVTNPPFSLFREYVAQLVKYGKKFIIIGNMNAITCKEIFPLIKDNKMWSGATRWGSFLFVTPSNENTRSIPAIWFTNLEHGRRHKPLSLMTMADNLRYSKHKEIRGKKHYDRYDNYDAIEVPFTDAIPSDYPGVMGVPISWLGKYCPEQFEILECREPCIDLEVLKQNSEFKEYKSRQITYGGKLCQKTYHRILIRHRIPGHTKYDRPYVNGRRMYFRIFIRHRKAV